MKKRKPHPSTDDGKRQRLTFTVSMATVHRLKELAANEGMPVSRVAEALLEEGLSSLSKTNRTPEQVFASIKDDNLALQNEVRLLRDTVLGFILQYFCNVPPMIESEKQKAWTLGKARFQRFVAQLDHQLAAVEKDEAA